MMSAQPNQKPNDGGPSQTPNFNTDNKEEEEKIRNKSSNDVKMMNQNSNKYKNMIVN